MYPFRNERCEHRNKLIGRKLHEFRMKDSGFGCLRETGMESMRTATKKHRMNSGSVKKKIFLGFF